MNDDERDVTFERYRIHLLAELKRLNENVDDVRRKVEQFREDDLSQLKTDIALLKQKMILIGASVSIVVTGLIQAALKLTAAH